MPIQLISATEADYPVVQNLAGYYVYDFTEYTGWTCPETGRFGGCDELFDEWRAGTNYPFIIRVDGELAGFAGVARDEERGVHYVQEFFVLRKFRRKGVGKQVAFELFDCFPGAWRVGQLTVNAPAVVFWRAVIDDYTNGAYTDEGVVASPWGAISYLAFCNHK